MAHRQGRRLGAKGRGMLNAAGGVPKVEAARPFFCGAGGGQGCRKVGLVAVRFC